MAFSDVLILGAGASVPYGFPTGRGLRDKILDEVAVQISRESSKKGFVSPIFWGEDSCGTLPFHISKLTEFLESFHLAQTYSIDAFIERRPEKFIKIGKYMISDALMKSENLDKLFRAGDWYQAFWNRILPNGRFAPRNCSIITFNYDRSLQTYLETAYQAALDPENRTDPIDSFIHFQTLHGTFAAAKTIPFGKCDPSKYAEFAEEIDFPFEYENTSSANSHFSDARSTIEGAERIFILGFGFDQTNTERIFKGCDYSQKKIFATRVGLDRASVQRAEDVLGGSIVWYGASPHAMEDLITENF